MQLTLADFGCRDAEPPSWLPAHKWDDILAISVLPGSFSGLCVKVAKHSDAWKDWYCSEAPEIERFPRNTDENHPGMINISCGCGQQQTRRQGTTLFHDCSFLPVVFQQTLRKAKRCLCSDS